MKAMPNKGVARLTIGIDTNAAITSPEVKTIAAFCLRIALAQPSPDVANQLNSRCRPIASTTISTSANPTDRHRMERIGGDRICESALTAASNMMVVSSAKPWREVAMLMGLGKGRGWPLRRRAAAHVRAESGDRNNHDDPRGRDHEFAKATGIAVREQRTHHSSDCIFQMERESLV